MPFTSRRQARAAFGGHIPGFDRSQAKEWADETDFSKLPDHVKKAGAHGKALFIARRLRDQMVQSGVQSGAGQAAYDKINGEKRAFVEFCTKLAFAVPRPGQVTMSDKHVGSFSGQATTNFLKAPGSTTAAVTNPRLNLRNAMTKTMRT